MNDRLLTALGNIGVGFRLSEHDDDLCARCELVYALPDCQWCEACLEVHQDIAAGDWDGFDE